MSAAAPACGRAAARIVVEGGAVYTRTSGDPFFFTSGWASPIFIDIKRLISLPAARDTLVAIALETDQAVIGRRHFRHDRRVRAGRAFRLPP